MFGFEDFGEGVEQAGGDHLWRRQEIHHDAWIYRNSNGLTAMNIRMPSGDLTYSCKLWVQTNSQKHEEEQNGPQRGNRKLRQSIWICNECQAKSCTKTKKQNIGGVPHFYLLVPTWCVCLTFLHHFSNRHFVDVSHVTQNWKYGKACQHTRTLETMKTQVDQWEKHINYLNFL